ncbi:MAG TPA: terminase large subunit [Pirellulales bacterium]|nr:terminase large subunit [Pirellulales bacterium]
MNDSQIKAAMADPAVYRSLLHLDNGDPWVLDGWQDQFFRATDAGWQRAIGHKAAGGFSRAWSVRPRGHSKSTDIGSMVAWALLSAPRERPVKGVVAAADEDQARIVADAVRRIIRANAWLGGYIDVQRGRIINTHTDSECTIIASDAATSYGLLADFIIADELTYWRSRELWDSLFSASAKKPTCFLAVLSNAGIIDSWQHALWLKLQTDPSWFCHSLPGPVASWISPAALAEQARVLLPIVYQRVWLNIWVRGIGDAISLDDITASITQAGPMLGDEPGFYFGGGIDLSSKRDHSAVCILAANPHSGRVRLAYCESWKPRADGTVDVIGVQNAVIRCHYRYARCGFLIDPAEGGHLMLQHLRILGITMAEKSFSSQPNLNQMATSIVQGFRDRKIDLYDDPDLIADLGRLNIQDRAFGVKLAAPRDKQHGHADRAFALAIALPTALAIAMSGGNGSREPPPLLPNTQSDPDWGRDVRDIDSPYPNLRDEFRGR